MRDLKQHNIAREKTIGGNLFMIRPFPAFTATNISGELAGILAPVLAGVLPAIGGSGVDVMNLDINAFSGALSSLSGDKVESVLRRLLIKHNNVTVQLAGESEALPLDADMANEVFCGSAQDMFILAYEVIQANFSDFFEKLGSQFGVRKAASSIATTE